METNVHKYGMRLRPYDIGCQPEDGLVCVADGGTVDGRRYHNFLYYIDRLDSETVCNYDLDFLGVKLLNSGVELFKQEREGAQSTARSNQQLIEKNAPRNGGLFIVPAIPAGRGV